MVFEPAGDPLIAVQFSTFKKKTLSEELSGSVRRQPFSLFLLVECRGEAVAGGVQEKPDGASPVEESTADEWFEKWKEVPMNKIVQNVWERKKEIQLTDGFQELGDGRKAAKISAQTIAQVVWERVPRGQSSLWQVDQESREEEVRGWHGSLRRQVVSDGTLFRALGSFRLAAVHEGLWKVARKRWEALGKQLELPSGEKRRIGVVDGSGWGGFQGSVLALLGREADVVAGYRMSPGKGHELATSRALLEEAAQELGRGFVDLVLEDGLYMTEEDFRRAAAEHGQRLLVKTSEERLTVMQDTRAVLFGFSSAYEGELEKVSGVDEERMVEYEVQAAIFLRHGLRLKVAHVKERHLEPRAGRPPESSFWVVSNDLNLSAQDMRVCAHLRWRIENGIFRRLSHVVDSKRRLTQDAHVREALLGLWFIGLNLLAEFLTQVKSQWLDPSWRALKKTWRWFGRLFK